MLSGDPYYLEYYQADYDRLVKGGASGRIYVSFDNVAVGKLIG